MNTHPEILAKGLEHGRVTLYQHLKNVAEVVTVIARNTGFDEHVAVTGALLHDIGKASPLFQQTLRKDYIPRPGFVFRHEIASLFFLPLVKEEHRNAVIDMVVAHHKSAMGDAHKLGIVDLDDYTSENFETHAQGFAQWSVAALDILEALGVPIAPISIDDAREAYERVVDYCCRKPCNCSMWRGLLMAADHLASAMETRSEMPLDKLFIKPDLSFYSRQSSLYPLSLISAGDARPHTIVKAPTGAGKTDFLLRRCRGRVFYTLPYQASINAMYDRIKHDLSNTSAQVYLLHAASGIKVKDGKLEERIMQRHVGASVKVMTPHQMASVVFGIKGYESMALDVRGCDVILDEIHTYGSVMQAIVLRIIEILVRLGCRVHVGTATMPQVLYDKILALLGGKEQVYEVSLGSEELSTFNRHRLYKLSGMDKAKGIVDKAVAAKSKVLIVCNQVLRAQNMYDAVKARYPGVKCMLLHSKFKRCDRSSLEQLLTGEFNVMEGEPCIVVSTQVVEVSLDISFDLMVTECAPIDSLIQRFGRINRRRNAATIGHYKPIYVVAPPDDKVEALPYNLDVLKRTFNVLPGSGSLLEECMLQGLIDAIYGDASFSCIDYTGGIAYADGRWTLTELCHHAKSALLAALDINTTVCVTEADRDAYVHGNRLEQAQLEIPVSYSSIAYCNLDQLQVGLRPFVVPNKAYDEEIGLIARELSPSNYTKFEIF